MRKMEQYSVKDGKTPLSGEELSQRFLDIDGRLHQLELLKVSWEEAVALVQNHGLERINNVIQPVLDQANDILGLIQQEFNSVKTEWTQTSQAIAQEWQGILDEWDGVADTLTAMQASLDAMQVEIGNSQAAAQSYTDSKTDFTAYKIDEWTASDDDHPYTNFENSSVRGKATIKMPADAESWLMGTFAAKSSNANINLTTRYMMSTSDTDPMNWGLAYAVGSQDLCAVPRQDSTTYTIGDRVCANPPDGCTYEMIEGAAGYGATDILTGGTISAYNENASFPVTNAVDDNDSNLYLSASYLTTAGLWVKYDLGSGNEVAFGKVRVKWNIQARTPTSMIIQGSNDDSNWVNLSTVYPSTYEAWEEYFFDNSTAYRYLRLYNIPGTATQEWYIHEIEAFELLGSTGTSDSSQPSMNQALNAETTDNEITWKCISIDNYDTLSLTGETAPATAWTEGTKSFVIPGAGISAGDLVRTLVIRKVDPPTYYWQEQDLSAATLSASVSGGTVPYLDTTFAGLYDGNYSSDDKWIASHLGFRSSYEGSMIGAYLQVQFSASKEIGKIIITQPFSTDYASQITLQYSTDGTNWTDLQAFTGLSYGISALAISSPASAVYYRLVCMANMYQFSNGYRNWTIGELEMYTYEANAGSGHDGDLHLINATHQAVEV